MDGDPQFDREAYVERIKELIGSGAPGGPTTDEFMVMTRGHAYAIGRAEQVEAEPDPADPGDAEYRAKLDAAFGMLGPASMDAEAYLLLMRGPPAV